MFGSHRLFATLQSSPKAPLGSTAYPFSRILDPTSKTSLAKVRASLRSRLLYSCMSRHADRSAFSTPSRKWGEVMTGLAQVDGHTSGGEWPQYGMLIARSGPKDRSGYFIVGALPQLNSPSHMA